MKLILFLLCFIVYENAECKSYKIYAVHSYSENFPWSQIIIESYKKELEKNKIKFEIKNSFFDVKKSPWDLKIPHPLLETIKKEIILNKPDIVFLTDDFALHQLSSFIVTEKLSFIFAGLNGEIPDVILNSSFKNYSGVYERYYIKESIRLLRRLVKAEKLNLLFLLEDSETSRYVQNYISEQLKNDLNVSFETLISNDFNKWKEKVSNEHDKYNAILPLQPFSLRNEKNDYMDPADVIYWFYQNSKKPTVYTSGWQIKCGGTVAIAHRPSSQGELSAKLTIDGFNNFFGKKLTPPQGDIEINYQSTKKLKINIPFDLLSTATIEKRVEYPCTPR